MNSFTYLLRAKGLQNYPWYYRQSATIVIYMLFGKPSDLWLNRIVWIISLTSLNLTRLFCSSIYDSARYYLCQNYDRFLLGSSTHICSTIYLLRSSVALLFKLAVRISWVKSLWILYFLFLCYGRCVFTLSSYFCWLDIGDRWKPMHGKELKFWTGNFTYIYRYKYSYIYAGIR